MHTLPLYILLFQAIKILLKIAKICLGRHIYMTSLLERLFFLGGGGHNNDYTSIGYQHGNIVSKIINVLVQD